MNRKFELLKIFTIIVFLALLPSTTYAIQPTEGTLRIGLTSYRRDTKQITVIASSDFLITKTGTSDKLASSTNLTHITLEAGESEIILKRDNGASASVGTSVTVIPADPNATITLDSPSRSMQYRGTIEVSIKSGTLRLVNIVRMEDYLFGVTPAEMPATFPQEAVKAQTIAARTYARNATRRHSADGYDLCDGEHCQVYGGTLKERAKSTKAVLATNGMVLTYNGQLIDAMYSADCGGITQSFAESYCVDEVPYLCVVAEPTDIQHTCWEKTSTLLELADKLTKAGIVEATGLRSIKAVKTSSSGRVTSIEIAGEKAIKIISGAKIRSLLGLKSILFTVECSEDGIVLIKGKGYGHGIGMCQMGAKALAEPPYNYTYDQILGHYYPGTKITQGSGSVSTSTTVTDVENLNTSRVIYSQTVKVDSIPSIPEKKKPTKHNNVGVKFDVRVKAPHL